MYPHNIKYSKEHEWLKIEDDSFYVGITFFAQKELGDIVFIDITTEGETLSKGETFGTIEAVKTVSDLFIPISGKIIEINPEVLSNPEIINKDPYGSGWIVKITPTDLTEIDSLLSQEDYLSLVG